MKILVAEDNLFYRRMLQSLLGDWGYEVIAVDNGVDAFGLLAEEGAPRIAILDWMMPGMDGLEVCRRVRSLKQSGPTYLILLTVKEGKENIIAALRQGADDYITKPFHQDELHARLQVGRRIVDLQSALASRVRQLEESLSGAAKMQAIGRLAGGIAHDFNNMLTVILGSSDALLRSMQCTGAAAERVEEIQNAAERAAGLTRQLLAFSRKSVLKPTLMNVNEMIRAFQKIFGRLIGENHQIQLNLDDRLRNIKADRSQLEQVLMNLVVNARDAMPDGGTLTIETANIAGASPSEEGSLSVPEYIRLSVTDTGCGMDENTQANIFEPFFTTKEAGKGVGLGLATVHGIVNQSGGTIHVQSKLNVGTTFHVLLPSVATEAPELAAPPQLPDGDLAGRETILLVEDETGVRDLACEVLECRGYRVLSARDGVEALRIAGEFNDSIDLLLTDVIMPKLDGWQVAEKLIEGRPDTKVLFMSGYTEQTAIFSEQPSLADCYLPKPFTPLGLARKVRQVLGQGA